MEYYDILRLVNAACASVLFGAVVYKARLYFMKYDMHQKLVTISYGLYTLALSYGSIEAINVGSPPGARTWFFLAATLVGLYAFFRYRDSAFKVPVD